MKTVYVLSGGGAKGAFQVGAMQRLAEAGVKPDAIYGTSVGALNAAGHAALGILGLTETWLKIQSRGDILSSNWWKLPFAKGQYSTKPLKKHLDAVLGMPNLTPMCDAIACYVVLNNGTVADSKQYAYLSKLTPALFAQAVLASASIPFAMDPVEVKDESGKTRYLVDGGVQEQTPLKQAILDGADQIYVILCNPVQLPPDAWEGPSWPWLFSLGMRAVDIMEHEVFLNDINTCLGFNNRPDKRKIDLKVIAPDRLLLDTLDFIPEKIRAAIAQGRSSV